MKERLILMKKVCYPITPNAWKRVKPQLMRVPCFVLYDEHTEELTVGARQEDLPYIERTLAPFV
jgi:hypothetical protein